MDTEPMDTEGWLYTGAHQTVLLSGEIYGM